MNDAVESQLAQADSLMTWIRDGAVKLRMKDSGVGSEPPVTVMEAFKETVDRNPDRIALSTKESGSWTGFSFRWYYERVRCAAKAFIKLGLEPYHGVGILGFNSPEWVISDLGAIMAGGFAVGIYTTNSADACHYVLENGSCQIVVVENDYQLQKILQVKDRLPELRSIIQYKGEPPEDCLDVLSWDGLMQYGDVDDEDLDKELQKRIAAQNPNRCCMLIYTSGTTGAPKGVMLSHDNVTFTGKMAHRVTRLALDAESSVSYLPLSHAAAQLFDIFIPVVCGVTMYFAQPDALKGSLKTTLTDVRPTYFFGVPRVFERMQEAIVTAGRKNGCLKRRIAAWAKNVGLRSNMAAMEGRRKLICYPLARALVFKKVRAALGFDRCKIMISGAAPITRETLEFFLSLDLPILEGYGMSESSGPHTVNMPWSSCITSVGKELPGFSTMIFKPDEDGHGEICMGGRQVFMGYLNMPEKTQETIDDDGWLHTGDIGYKNPHGYLFITGRIKELIITAGGENIPPVPIEDQVKKALPCVSNCMLIGDKRKFLSMLITLKVEVDAETGEPFDTMTPVAIDWCRSVGCNLTKVSDIIDYSTEKMPVSNGGDKSSDDDEAPLTQRAIEANKVLEAIQQGIDVVNSNSTSRAQRIQKWSILRRDFSMFGGELGPTLKLKRPDVHRMYAETTDAFYAVDE